MDGMWKLDEANMKSNINILELRAVFLGLKCFISVLKYKHVKVEIDNSATVAYINNMGGTYSLMCHNEARNIWYVAKINGICLTAVHLAGKRNVTAYYESKNIRTETEWMLNRDIFALVTRRSEVSDVDLFASRFNFQCKPTRSRCFRNRCVHN